MSTVRNPDATRETLLRSAFMQMYEHGFQGTSLDAILSHTGVTKGALYHHFPNKMALGYAVLDDLVGPYIHQVWIAPLEETDDPITVMLHMLMQAQNRVDFDIHRLGCPLNNLAQEMSPLDDGFRVRIQRLFEEWRNGFVEAFRRGQAAGTVRPDIDPQVAGGFLLAVIEGVASLAKAAQDRRVLDEHREGVRLYLEGLRPQPKR